MRCGTHRRRQATSAAACTRKPPQPRTPPVLPATAARSPTRPTRPPGPRHPTPYQPLILPRSWIEVGGLTPAARRTAYSRQSPAQKSVSKAIEDWHRLPVVSPCGWPSMKRAQRGAWLSSSAFPQSSLHVTPLPVRLLPHAMSSLARRAAFSVKTSVPGSPSGRRRAPPAPTGRQLPGRRRPPPLPAARPPCWWRGRQLPRRLPAHTPAEAKEQQLSSAHR